MLSASIEQSLRDTEQRLRDAHATHLGYPYNLTSRSPIPAGMADLLINNLGDPYAGSHFGSEVCDLEREAVAWLQDLWESGAAGETWGSVGASGTEGNLWSIYLGREALPQAVLIHSDEAHYSIAKAARAAHRGRLSPMPRQRRHRRWRVGGSPCAHRRPSGHRGAHLRHDCQGRA